MVLFYEILICISCILDVRPRNLFIDPDEFVFFYMRGILAPPKLSPYILKFLKPSPSSLFPPRWKLGSQEHDSKALGLLGQRNMSQVTNTNFMAILVSDQRKVH